MQTAENTTEISKLRMNIGSVEKQMPDVMDQLNDVVTKSELADMMNSFVSDEDNGWIMGRRMKEFFFAELLQKTQGPE